MTSVLVEHVDTSGRRKTWRLLYTSKDSAYVPMHMWDELDFLVKIRGYIYRISGREQSRFYTVEGVGSTPVLIGRLHEMMTSGQSVETIKKTRRERRPRPRYRGLVPYEWLVGNI